MKMPIHTPWRAEIAAKKSMSKAAEKKVEKAWKNPRKNYKQNKKVTRNSLLCGSDAMRSFLKLSAELFFFRLANTWSSGQQKTEHNQKPNS
jgi:hypothetical protein